MSLSLRVKEGLAILGIIGIYAGYFVVLWLSIHGII
jgi:hypothetical protein